MHPLQPSRRVGTARKAGHRLRQVNDDLGLGCLGLDPLHELGSGERQDEIPCVRIHLEAIFLVPVAGHPALDRVMADSHAGSLCIPCALGEGT